MSRARKKRKKIEPFEGPKTSSAIIKPKGAIAFGFVLLTVLTFLAPLLVLDRLTDNADLSKRAFIEIGALLLLFVWFVEGWRSGGLKIAPCRLYWPLLCFAGGTFFHSFSRGTGMGGSTSGHTGVPVWHSFF